MEDTCTVVAPELLSLRDEGTIPCHFIVLDSLGRSDPPRRELVCHRPRRPLRWHISLLLCDNRGASAMPDKVTNNSPDNRTLNATARPHISLTCEGNGGKAKDGRNEKQLFHINTQQFRRALVSSSQHAKITCPDPQRAC